MMISLASISHFFVDAVCCAALFSQGASAPSVGTAILLYDTLAFSTQCLAGSWIDRFRHEKLLWPLAMAAVFLGALMPGPLLLRVAIFALGNSLFHVSAGALVLRENPEDPRPSGVFVAPGAIGVAVGVTWPGLRIPLAVCLLFLAAAAFLLMKKERDDVPGPSVSEEMAFPVPQVSGEMAFPVLPVVLLTAAVAVRAIGGSAVAFPWKTGVAETLLMTACVFAGKFAGGFLCRRVGERRCAWISIVPAAVCIAFFSAYMIPSLAGQFLLNLSMPLTLWLLYRAIPDSPGLAFGLAASALWPGTIAGMLFRSGGPLLTVRVLISFLFGIFAVVFAAERLGIDKK